MNQQKCPECGTIFSAQLSECPECGCPASNFFSAEDTLHPQEQGMNYQQAMNDSQHPNQPTPTPKKSSFEIVCYCLAGICAVLFIFTPTTRGGYTNFDGSSTALRWEIAAFGWLIVGRLTAIFNK